MGRRAVRLPWEAEAEGLDARSPHLRTVTRRNPMWHAVSRLLVRGSIVVASLAWAGFVFTNTVGDPGRGERIATAVLADEGARAEVVAPLASAVTRTAGLPATRQPAVAVQVDALLQDPASARTFIGPFSGQWARMVGTADARSEGYDIETFTDRVLAGAPGLADGVSAPVDGRSAAADRTAEEALVSAMPLPRARLGWLLPGRDSVTRVTGILAWLAVAGFVVGFVIGDRRWVLRRGGAWATLAGSVWVIVPLGVVWAARRWATGADSIVTVAVREAVSGLRPTALVLVVGGVLAFAASFAPVPAWCRRPFAPGRVTEPVRSSQGDRAEPRRAGRTAPGRGVAFASNTTDGWPTVDRTFEMPAVAGTTDEIPMTAAHEFDGAGAGQGHHDPVWNFYA